MVMDIDVMLMLTMNGMVVRCQHKVKGSFMGNCTILKTSPLSSLTTKAHATIIQKAVKEVSYRRILPAPHFVLHVHFGFIFDQHFRHFVVPELDHMTKRCHLVLCKQMESMEIMMLMVPTNGMVVTMPMPPTQI